MRAHRWRRKIESGGAATFNEVAKRDGVTGPYVYRLLRITVLNCTNSGWVKIAGVVLI